MRAQDRDFYSAAIHYFDAKNADQLATHIATVRSYVEPILPKVRAHMAGKPVRFLELGAGTCLSTLLFRQEFPNSEFTCFDISLSRMQSLIGSTAQQVGSSADGINLIEGDFTDRLPFETASFDIILFDAALHHSRSIWTTLEECHRILAPDGAVAAMREAYLAKFTSAYAMRRLQNSPEFSAGVAENAYLKEQYDYYFRAARFEPHFQSVSPGKWALLSPLNGLLFSKWSIWAPKAAPRGSGSTDNAAT